MSSIFSEQAVTRSQAMEIPTVSACINKIAETISRLPVKLYKKENGRITEITDDNRLSLLNGETGDTLSTVDMWKAVTEDYFLGNGAWIYLNSDGIKTKSLHYVDSRNISIMTNNDPIFKAFDIMVNGRKFYDFQFIRLFRKTKNGYSNIPIQDDNPKILSVAYNSLKLENKMNKTGGNKGGFLKSKNKLSAEALETVKTGCRALYDNDNEKIPVLNDGLDFQPVSSTAVELQINENKKVNSVEICKIFGFPHTVIDGGATDDDNKKFISAITAILNQIETALDAFLLLEKEKYQGFYFAFDTKELTRGSLRERYEAYQIAVKNHILQVDEIRREEDYEPLGFNFVTMGLGDVLLNPKTMEVFTPNTGQTAKLDSHGEERAEIELRYNHNHDEKGRFCSGGGGGRMSSSSAENSAKSLDNSEKSDIMKEADMFHTEDDPLREVMGSAYDNNRDELFTIIDNLEAMGIEVDISDTNRSMGYQPSISITENKPGRIKMDKEASISAWKHENQHAEDDRASGWKGMDILINHPEERYQWEVRAYAKEIEIAKSLKRNDMVQRLEQLLEKERKAIFGEE
ncbi:MAG: phage portal protein [Ruminococcus sp.]|nr:phage portal protein [Ruminococcus sp.]